MRNAPPTTCILLSGKIDRAECEDWQSVIGSRIDWIYESLDRVEAVQHMPHPRAMLALFEILSAWNANHKSGRIEGRTCLVETVTRRQYWCNIALPFGDRLDRGATAWSNFISLFQ
jgi:hypothetical protein